MPFLFLFLRLEFSFTTYKTTLLVSGCTETASKNALQSLIVGVKCIEPRLSRSCCSKGSTGSQVPQNKYAELLAIIEELGKEIRPTYAGSKTAMERLKRGKRIGQKRRYLSAKVTCSQVGSVSLLILYFFVCFEGIIHARGLVRECLAETERNARS